MDVEVNSFGSVCIFVPLTEAAQGWVEDCVPDRMEYAGGFVVEPRCAGDLIEGMQQNGLEVGRG